MLSVIIVFKLSNSLLYAGDEKQKEFYYIEKIRDFLVDICFEFILFDTAIDKDFFCKCNKDISRGIKNSTSALLRIHGYLSNFKSLCIN